jgi:hypothetical protein
MWKEEWSNLKLARDPLMGAMETSNVDSERWALMFFLREVGCGRAVDSGCGKVKSAEPLKNKQ